MPAPVIEPTSSILDFEQHQPWSFQPFATNAPTSWSIDPIAPAGMSFDPVRGTLAGACTSAGVYVFGLRAINGDGTSAPLVLTVGIEPATASSPRNSAVEVDIDLITRQAKVVGAAGTANYLHAVKFRDDLIYHVRFKKGDVVMANEITELAFAFKTEPQGRVLASSDEWEQVVFGSSPVYAVHSLLSASALRNALREADKVDDMPPESLVVTCEFEWLQANAAGVGPNPLRGSSQGMPVLAVNDFAQLDA